MYSSLCFLMKSITSCLALPGNMSTEPPHNTPHHIATHLPPHNTPHHIATHLPPHNTPHHIATHLPPHNTPHHIATHLPPHNTPHHIATHLPPHNTPHHIATHLPPHNTPHHIATHLPPHNTPHHIATHLPPHNTPHHIATHLPPHNTPHHIATHLLLSSVSCCSRSFSLSPDSDLSATSAGTCGSIVTVAVDELSPVVSSSLISGVLSVTSCSIGGRWRLLQCHQQMLMVMIAKTTMITTSTAPQT